jgi:hypothetical protein
MLQGFCPTDQERLKPCVSGGINVNGAIRYLNPLILCLRGHEKEMETKNMKAKKEMRVLSLLMVLALAGAMFVPVVSAGTQYSEGVDLDSYVVPDLKIDSSLEEIAISGKLSPQSEIGEIKDNTYGIPFGSIIEYDVDGITRIYDPDGNHLLSISDEKSEKIATPAGVEKPCTKVCQLPNDSIAYYRGNMIFICNSEGELILLILDNDNESSCNSNYGSKWIGNDWIESAEDNDVDYITENIAYWSVPTEPPSLESNEMIYLFNSITGESGSDMYILQPVLRYYGSVDQWEGEAWACNPDGPDLTGPIFTSDTGHTIKGRVYWSTSLNTWSITVYDQTNGQYSSISTSCIAPQANSRVACALEGWHIEDNTDVPGDTLFYDMEYESYGSPMSVYLEPWYSSFVPSVIMQYCQVDIISNPTRASLNTYN